MSAVEVVDATKRYGPLRALDGRMVLDPLPFNQSVRLLADGVSPRTVFDTGAFSWLVILAWALVGHALLVRVATRREL